MLSIFKRKTNGEKADEEQKQQSLERIVESVKQQADEVVEDLGRARVRRMLREALGGDN